VEIFNHHISQEKKFYESVEKEFPEPGPYSEPPEDLVSLRGRSIQDL
jgi:hypothetical protein